MALEAVLGTIFSTIFWIYHPLFQVL